MSSWRDHSPEFVDVREYDDGRPIVVMELRPADADVLRETWDELRALWLDLPPHPNILDAIDRAGRGLLVRYAAIDWRRTPLALDAGPATSKLAASWGVELCNAYEHLARCSTPGRLRRFLCPMLHVDIDGCIRLGFLPPSPAHRVIGRFVAPELRSDRPVDDETALVFLVGTAMTELTRPPAQLLRVGESARPSFEAVIARCVEEDPAKRYPTLRELRRAFRHAGPVRATPRSKEELADFAKIEEELGWRTVRPSADGSGYAGREIARHIPWADRATPRPHPAEPPPPGSARALFLEGKELFARGRLDDARAAFARALAVDPRLIEAMHLRREVDRVASAVRAEAGHQYDQRVDIDESLARSARLEAQLARLDEKP